MSCSYPTTLLSRRVQSVGRAPNAATCPSYLTASPTCSDTSVALGLTAATAWNMACNSNRICMAIALVSI